MNGFLAALLDPNLAFLRNALLAGILSSVLFGVLGSVVTVKRISGTRRRDLPRRARRHRDGALSFRDQNRPMGHPHDGPPLAFAILAAAIIGIVSLRAKQREDTVINAIWAIGMSIGVLFMAKTPGYTDPSSYLFGNILLVSGKDLILLAALDVVVLFLAWRFYPQIEASSFDEEFARVRGVHTHVVFFALLAITAISVVLLQTFVGIVMVIAMLTLPAGTAGYGAKNLAGMMVIGTVLSLIFSAGGLALGWALDAPVGAMVVVIAGAIFLAAAAIRAIARKRPKGNLPGGAGAIK